MVADGLAWAMVGVIPQHHIWQAVLTMVWFIVPYFPGSDVLLLRSRGAQTTPQYPS